MRQPEEFQMDDETIKKIFLRELQSDIVKNCEDQDIAKCNFENQDEDEEEFNQFIKETLGSNAYVIHGNYTQSGKPIIAGEPHSEFNAPTMSMQVKLIFGEEEQKVISGMVLCGTIFFQQAITDYTSYSVTMSRLDTSDLYELQIEGQQYKYEDQMLNLKVFPEHITIKGQDDPVNILVYESHHGVILDYLYNSFSPLMNKFFTAPENKRYAFSWIGNEISYGNIFKILDLPFAQNIREVKQILDEIPFPSLSIVFTVNGDIGFGISGLIPIKQNFQKGQTPKDGSKKVNDWIGFVPREQKPFSINPKRGYISAVNNKLVYSRDPLYEYVATNFNTPRAQRANQIIDGWIKSGEKISIEHIKQLQFDTVDVYAEEILPKLIQLTRQAIKDRIYIPKQIKLQQLDEYLELFNNWNYDIKETSYLATIYNIWIKKIYSQLFKGIKLSERNRINFVNNEKFDLFFKNFLDHFVGDTIVNSAFNNWCTTVVKSENFKDQCLTLFLKSLEESLIFISKETNTFQITEWNWGKFHQWKWGSPFQSSILRGLYGFSMSGPGNSRTLLLSEFENKNVKGRKGPVARMICDMSNRSNVQVIYDTGIGGNIFSKHFKDQNGLFMKGQYIEYDSLGKNVNRSMYFMEINPK